MKISVTDKQGSGIALEFARAIGATVRGRFFHIPERGKTADPRTTQRIYLCTRRFFDPYDAFKYTFQKCHDCGDAEIPAKTVWEYTPPGGRKHFGGR